MNKDLWATSGIKASLRDRAERIFRGKIHSCNYDYGDRFFSKLSYILKIQTNSFLQLALNNSTEIP